MWSDVSAQLPFLIRRLIAVIVLGVLSTGWATAQNERSITLVVQDSLSGEPVVDALVELVRDDSTIASSRTDDDGIVGFVVQTLTAEDDDPGDQLLPRTGIEIGFPFPNPTSGNASILLSCAEDGRISIYLFDILGRRIARTERGTTAQKLTVRISTAGLASGVYFVIIRGNNSSPHSRALTVTSSRAGTPGITLESGWTTDADPSTLPENYSLDGDLSFRITRPGYRLRELDFVGSVVSESVISLTKLPIPILTNGIGMELARIPAGSFTMTPGNWSRNVSEWTHDFYSPEYYQSAPDRDPIGPEAGEYHVVRGGAFDSGAAALRSSARSMGLESNLKTIGFRIARTVTR